uniref:AB hydrolase-1 domain-containing protein n=1 Tax=Angiostrongylus cantonensis TaxID=6313 RepID=A0A0K0CUG0_ANGCA
MRKVRTADYSCVWLMNPLGVCALVWWSQFCRYVFMFQTPVVPELFVRSRDFHMFDVMIRGKKAGIKHSENFTDEDLEAWKHVFSQPVSFLSPTHYRAFPSFIQQCFFQPPTIIIWGDDDQFLTKESATTSLQLKFVEGASHWVMQDEPSRVNELVDDFLAMPISKKNS